MGIEFADGGGYHPLQAVLRRGTVIYIPSHFRNVVPKIPWKKKRRALEVVEAVDANWLTSASDWSSPMY